MKYNNNAKKKGRSGIMDFRYRLMRFLSGRYGADRLFFVIFAVSAVLSVANIFIRSIILQCVVYALMLYAIFRVFSRNTVQRSREDAWVFEKLGFIKRKKELHERRKNDKCHIYKKCPSCKAILRLPRRIGVHKTVCPKCGKEFTVRVRK